MAVISTLLDNFSFTEFAYKAVLAIVVYWAFHILSQIVTKSTNAFYIYIHILTF